MDDRAVTLEASTRSSPGRRPRPTTAPLYSLLGLGGALWGARSCTRTRGGAPTRSSSPRVSSTVQWAALGRGARQGRTAGHAGSGRRWRLSGATRISLLVQFDNAIVSMGRSSARTRRRNRVVWTPPAGSSGDTPSRCGCARPPPWPPMRRGRRPFTLAPARLLLISGRAGDPVSNLTIREPAAHERTRSRGRLHLRDSL